MEKIRFQSPDGTVEDFYIEEQTRIGGVAYLLVSDSMDDEANAYILKDVSEDTDSEAFYEMVEDENELQAVYKVFEQMHHIKYITYLGTLGPRCNTQDLSIVACGI